MAFHGKWIIKWEKIRVHHCIPLRILLALNNIFKENLPVHGNIIICEKDSPEVISSQKFIRLKIPLERARLPLNKLTQFVNELSIKTEKIENDIFKTNSPIKTNKNILLIFPYLKTDFRWRSMSAPPGLLFLADSLNKKGHNVKITLSEILYEPYPRFSIEEDTLNNFDWIGFPLYDDLFFPVSKAISHLKRRFKNKIAVGGPMATLSPLAVSSHLQEANLIIRGEAEEAFPEVLSFLDYPEENASNLLNLKGYLYRNENLLISSSFSEINKPNLKNVDISVEEIPEELLNYGLELNTSRGCPRSCIFCSHVHGKKFKPITTEKVGRWIDNFLERLKKMNIVNPQAFTVNINDDDILLNLDHFLNVIEEIKKRGFSLWGIQTSISSLIRRHEPDKKLIEILSDKKLYFKENPLLWIGTDVFIESRAKRLNKSIRNQKIIEGLLNHLDRKKILNYHYWILSDMESDWGEFLQEFHFILKMKLRFKETFFILPNSPFLIPYPGTEAFERIKNNNLFDRIRILWGFETDGFPEFTHKIVAYEIPKSEYLHSLLNPSVKPELRNVSSTFLDHLRGENYHSAFQEAIYYLNHEILFLKSTNENKERIDLLEEIKEKAISDFLALYKLSP
ncbi:MAG: hypothetical protein AB1410_01070 [Acidobacteriota bacterium]